MFNQFGRVLCGECRGAMHLVEVESNASGVVVRFACHNCDHDRELRAAPVGLPEGVAVVGLDDPAILHNSIAEAVGE